MVEAIRSAGGRLDDVLICPHAPEAGCACRKPQPGLLLEAARKHRFELSRAVLVGDSYRDVQAAQAVGAIAVMVRSGHAIPADVEVSLRGQRVPLAADLGAVVTLLTGSEHVEA
jgi:D-glycero-D-manno-heptose 1,7-bisphosphate phosphatase